MSKKEEIVIKKDDESRDKDKDKDNANNNLINISNNSKIFKKGLLWQNANGRRTFRNFFKHKWKQRYFILTNAYLACFKKEKTKISDMGSFLFKISLTDIKSVTVANDCLNINNDQIILWDGSNTILNEWLNCINDAKNSCVQLKRVPSNSSLINIKTTPIVDPKRLSRISGKMIRLK